MNDPKIVYPQNPLTSVSLLTNVIGTPIALAVSLLLTKYGLGSIVTPDFQAQVAAGIVATIMSVANIVVRKWFTGGDLSFSAPLTSTTPQMLLPGTATVVATSPSESAAPAVVTTIPAGTHTVTVPPPPNPVPPPPTVTVIPAVVPPFPAPVPPQGVILP